MMLHLECGQCIWDVLGVPYNSEDYEAFDFIRNEWVSSKDLMFWSLPFPYSVSAEDSVKQMTENIQGDFIAFYYKSNASFGVLRKSKLKEESIWD